jgi:hypothetical protein
MNRNMGSLDRVLRTLIAAPLLIVLGGFVFQLGSLPSIVALVLAAVMLATAAVGFCPLYAPFGVSNALVARGRPAQDWSGGAALA